MFQAAYRRHVERLYPKDGTRYWWAETHSKTSQQQNYKPQRMFAYLYPTIQSYPTRSNSDTVQQMSWRPAFLSSYVLMNQSHSSLPRIIRLSRSSQNPRVPILWESMLEITSVLRPHSANWKMSLSCITLSSYWALTSGAILLINEHSHSRLSRNSVKYMHCCYH